MDKELFRDLLQMKHVCFMPVSKAIKAGIDLYEDEREEKTKNNEGDELLLGTVVQVSISFSVQVFKDPGLDDDFFKEKAAKTLYDNIMQMFAINVSGYKIEEIVNEMIDSKIIRGSEKQLCVMAAIMVLEKLGVNVKRW